MKRLLHAIGAVGLVLIGTVVSATTAAADTQLCDKFGSTTVQNRYVVMNNVWGADTPQCIIATDSGFTITKADHNKPPNGAPASYPAIYVGCHYSNCSPGTNLPMQLGRISSATSSVGFAYPGSGVYDAAYDIWLDPTPKKDGVNQQEIMVWFDHRGPIQPLGSRVDTVDLAGRTWEVWTGNNGANNAVSYVAPSPVSAWSFSVLDFIGDVRSRGYITDSWYLTSVQAGFEPWVDGTGLAVTSFAVDIR